jgi:hypothetical protein
MLENGIGMPGGKRWTFTLTEDQVACKANCIMVHEFNISDALTSSNPNCPVTDLKFMADDGTGQPLP